MVERNFPEIIKLMRDGHALKSEIGEGRHFRLYLEKAGDSTWIDIISVSRDIFTYFRRHGIAWDACRICRSTEVLGIAIYRITLRWADATSPRAINLIRPRQITKAAKSYIPK